MTFRDLEYIVWAKSLPRVDINLARSGVEPCPASLLQLTAKDLVVSQQFDFRIEFFLGHIEAGIFRAAGGLRHHGRIHSPATHQNLHL